MGDFMKKNRNFALDILRVCAAAAVALYHVLGSSANNDPMVSGQLHSVITAISAMLQWHVPVFFLITGYLWLGDRKECTFEKVSSNILRFLSVLLSVGFAYAIMERFFVSRSISAELLINAFGDVMTGNLWDHMWYVYAIIGVYLVLPVLKSFFAQSDLKPIWILTGLLFVFHVLSPIVEEYWGYTIPISFPIMAPLFYVCAGGLLAKLHPVSNKIAFISLVTFVCGVAAVFLIALFARAYSAWIPLFSCFCAVALFAAVTARFSESTEVAWVRSVSDCSFGIYLFHPFFINLMIKVLRIFPLRWFPPLSIILASLAVVGLSYWTTCLLRKIGFIRKYIL